MLNDLVAAMLNGSLRARKKTKYEKNPKRLFTYPERREPSCSIFCSFFCAHRLFQKIRKALSAPTTFPGMGVNAKIMANGRHIKHKDSGEKAIG